MNPERSEVANGAASVLDRPRLTPAEVARKADVHVATVWRWMEHGVGGDRLPSLKIGNKRFVLSDDLEEFIVRRSTLDPPVRRGGGVTATHRAAAIDAELKAAGW